MWLEFYFPDLEVMLLVLDFELQQHGFCCLVNDLFMRWDSCQLE